MTMHSRLQNLPISFFSTIMGLSGLAIALQRAGDLWSPSAGLGDFVALLSMLALFTG
jgi:tellurite resistance protein TehA-like permease